MFHPKFWKISSHIRLVPCKGNLLWFYTLALNRGTVHALGVPVLSWTWARYPVCSLHTEVRHFYSCISISIFLFLFVQIRKLGVNLQKAGLQTIKDLHYLYILTIKGISIHVTNYITFLLTSTQTSIFWLYILLLMVISLQVQFLQLSLASLSTGRLMGHDHPLLELPFPQLRLSLADFTSGGFCSASPFTLGLSSP